jgi:bifunctional non-homologous end joining protein LigD
MLWRSPASVRRPPGFIEPCLPTLGQTVPTGPQWAYEIKHDGFRFICRRDSDGVRIFSRRGHDWTGRVPRIAEAISKLRVKSLTLMAKASCAAKMAFPISTGFAQPLADWARVTRSCMRSILEINGTDLRRDSWEVRRATLTSVLRKARNGIRLSEHLAMTDGNTIFRHACAMGLEGIVAKRRDRPFRSGRSPDWIKVKNPGAPAATKLIEGT